MKNLREYIREAREAGVAIGHFNVPTYEVALAVVLAGKKENVPVILGLSEGEREFLGVKEIVAWVKSIRENVYEPVFLNADHTYSYEKVKEAVDAGFDMVIYDDAGGNLEKNMEVAKRCREYIDVHNKEARKKGRAFFSRLFSPKDNISEVIFEAELGYIGKGSEVRTELPENIEKTSPELAKKFVDYVRPDLLAPAIGNVHGMLKDVPEPNLDEKLCGEIFETVKIPLVLHGASGNTKEDIQACIKNGVAIVHVSTELRVAYKNALVKVANEKEIAPYKYMKVISDEVQKVVEEKIKIFNFR